ncbi:hypothetical protein LCGC14_2078260 [marine sediment metagenome]|uniref:Uncharacterized protein n=1 Tax=marine sediment metagenome TaxID=412755 RepID=A0A0F9F3Q0_9ZZZZ
MALSDQQKAFLQNYQTDFDKLALLLADLEQLRQVYVKRVYSSIPDVDLEEVEITATQLADSTNMVNELVNNFLANLPITQGDWQGIMDRIRRL